MDLDNQYLYWGKSCFLENQVNYDKMKADSVQPNDNSNIPTPPSEQQQIEDCLGRQWLSAFWCSLLLMAYLLFADSMLKCNCN